MESVSDPNGGFTGTARFEVRSTLGRGAHGVVYRAFDRETHREVALKTVSEPNPEHAYLLRTEFRALAQITHPNLIALYDLVSFGATTFFTMELIEGETLAARIARAPHRLERRELTELASGLIAALDALHAQGRIHRDVKPSNIMITSGRVVLVDLGLSMELRLLARTRAGFAGTLLYMAPEQAWGRAISQSADVYSAAAVLWEALTGSPPFEGRGGAQLLFEKEERPRLPKGLPEEDVPLANVLAALMDPKPERRPPLANVLSALNAEMLAGPDARLDSTSAPPQSRSTPSGPHGPFVGRHAELETLSLALADLKNGCSAFVRVEGHSGIGKTELLSHFATSVEKSGGAVVLRGRCHPRESVPYAGFDGIIDDLSEWLMSLPDGEAELLRPSEVQALVTSFPILGKSLGVPAGTEALTDDAYDLRRSAVQSLRELLSNIARSRLVVLWIDDVQWGSADAGQLLADIFRRPTPPLLLVLSYRSEDLATSSFLRVLFERADALRESPYHIALAPMGDAESRELARFYLAEGDETEHGRDRVATDVAREAGGHPMFLRELALSMRNDGGGAHAPDLRSLLTDRIEDLSPTEKELLGLAAVAGRPLSRRILLAGTPQGEQGRPNVFRLAHERLLRETWTGSEPAVEPYHGYVRDAVLDTIGDQERRAYHRTIAEVLLREPEVDADALVDHFVGAADFAQAGSYAPIAAKRAEEALAFDRAILLYRLAIDHGPRGPCHPLRARLGAVLSSAGRSSESADAYAAAARDAKLIGAHDDAHTFERVAAENSLRGGDFEIGVRRLRSVLASAGVPYPSSPISAFATIVQQRALLAMRGLELTPRPEPFDSQLIARADACWAAGVGLTWIDRTRVAAFQSRYIRLALASGDPGRVGLALSTEASQLACLGGASRRKRADEILSRAQEITATRDPVSRAFVQLMEASVEFYASRWPRVVTLCADAEEILRQAKLRSQWEHLTADTLSLAALAYAGDLVTLRARQAERIAEARERGNRLAFACVASGPANVGFLVAGDPALARRRADEALAPWKNESFQLAHYLHLVAECQIDLYAERPAVTLDRLETEWRRVVLSMSLQVQNFRVTLRHLRGRAALASAIQAKSRRKRARLLQRARDEAKRIAADDVDWAMPLALSLEGGIAAAADDGTTASRQLEAAATRFREIGMRLHAAAADFQRGRFLGGDVGRVLERSAESWMLGEEVVSPELISAMLVPGVRA